LQTRKRTRGGAILRSLGFSLGIVVLFVFGVFLTNALRHTKAQQPGTQASATASVAPTPKPSPRLAPAIAFDTQSNKLVVFGGTGSDGTPDSDTWLFDSSGWASTMPATTPPSQQFLKAAYDSRLQKVVVVAGTQTWTWGGQTWNQQQSPSSPPSMDQPSLTYDAARTEMVLFGLGPDGHASTWIWDGTNWTQSRPNELPSSRLGAAMAYDDATKNVVLFGGQESVSSGLSDTWIWDGASWTQMHPLHSPPGGSATMAFDPGNGKIVLYVDAPGFVSQTWQWDGQDWIQQQPPSSPAARAFASMTYDVSLGKVVLFGGKTQAVISGLLRENVINELWAWDGSTWTQIN
jgi:hypothetical protein